ncbi:MAG: tRNA (adenosine(37)-N6)-threonylcarbamoyltransferase complex transferase subunit TsaD [Desulforegulaceae bacterium]|nr:tRNA (adenosine(37)-N6)-threonylcarbamoyltransferase complex transferase subunit TsaD [Desulforegulaceae bacterium]
MLVLGIESSCDETAASVVLNGKKVLSSIISSQIDDHSLYGGVVPEIASRKHLEAVSDVVFNALDQAGVKSEDLYGVAATQGPGLIGSLLVGFCFAKGFAFASNLKFTGVDHLHGHLMSVFLEEKAPNFPYVALLASGGHTSLYFVEDHLSYEIIGSTRDDAAGEAYDKVSKMLGLGYPGGKIIDEISKNGDPGKYPFPRAWLEKGSFDFSFSGLKSAVRRLIDSIPQDKIEKEIPHIAAGFQDSVKDVLVKKSIMAMEKYKCGDFALCGGVAANSGLRAELGKRLPKKGFRLFLPSVSLCGDNGSMIGCAGYYKFMKNKLASFDEEVYPRALFKLKKGF